MDKFKTYAITVRPRSGITDEQIQKFVRWVKKNSEFYYVITEKLGDSRHIHSALFLKREKKRSNVCTMILQLFKDFDPEEKSNLQKSIKILYSKDFLTTYMQKDDNTVVIERNLPELSALESWYPVKMVSPTQQRRLHMHDTMTQYETLWRRHTDLISPVNTKSVRDFLFDMQYNKRLIGLLDEKKLIQHSRWFTRWANKAEACPDNFLPPFETEEGPGIHDTRHQPLI